MSDLPAITDALLDRSLAWAPFIAFTVAFLESLPFIGLFVPGTSLLIAIGALASYHNQPLADVVLAAAAGAVIGSWVSYEVGCSQQSWIRRSPFLGRHPGLRARCEALFNRHGALSIGLGRFLPVIRPMIPMFSGAFGLEPRRFHLVNFISVIIWAPVFILPGALAGRTAQTFGWPALILIVTALAIPIAVVAGLGRANRGGDQDRPARLVLTIAIALLALVLALGHAVSSGGLASLDAAVISFIAPIRSALIDRAMTIFSALGDGALRTAATIVIAAALLFQRRWRWAAGLAFTMIGAALATAALKALFHVVRPSALYAGVDAFSFPSGHTVSATALFVVLSWMLTRRPARFNAFVWIFAGVMIAATAASRVYVGAHWASDVIAGIALGLAVALVGTVVMTPAPTPTASSSWVDLATVGGALLATALILGPAAIHKADAMYAPYLSATSSAPAAIKITPTQLRASSLSPRNTAPKTATNTTLSFSTGATRDASPAFKAAK